jgi:hypothetical protein
MKKYSRENLIRVETFIEEFNLDTNEINAEFNIDEIPLKQLQVIFECSDGDEELYLCYEIDKNIASQINEHLKVSINFDFSKYSYGLQRHGEYGDV